MSLVKRTPPTTPSPGVLLPGNVRPLAHSDPNLNTITDTDSSNVTHRTNTLKRRKEGELESFKGDIMDMFKELKHDMMEIKEQNHKLQESVDFTAIKYDEIMSKLEQMERDKIEDKKYIQLLESKLEQLERSDRATGIELRTSQKNLSKLSMIC